MANSLYIRSLFGSGGSTNSQNLLSSFQPILSRLDDGGGDKMGRGSSIKNPMLFVSDGFGSPPSADTGIISNCRSFLCISESYRLELQYQVTCGEEILQIPALLA